MKVGWREKGRMGGERRGVRYFVLNEGIMRPFRHEPPSKASKRNTIHTLTLQFSSPPSLNSPARNNEYWYSNIIISLQPAQEPSGDGPGDDTSDQPSQDDAGSRYNTLEGGKYHTLTYSNNRVIIAPNPATCGGRKRREAVLY